MASTVFVCNWSRRTIKSTIKSVLTTYEYVWEIPFPCYTYSEVEPQDFRKIDYRETDLLLFSRRNIVNGTILLNTYRY